MTRDRLHAKGSGRLFSNPTEVRIAYDQGEVDIQAPITVRINGERHRYHGRANLAVRSRSRSDSVQRSQSGDEEEGVGES